ncbi:MAG: hypothetical protein JSU87_15570 [Gemmatimonadota bacterium]|nr:MAG: hypothetical protein JSU87_15570 [Gemmatimonadota bacterium]
MIVPNVRASFGSGEIELLLRLLERETKRGRRYWERRLGVEGVDSLLDRPESFSGIMAGVGVSAMSPKLAFYIMVRHTLLDSGLDDRNIADYIATLLVEFAVEGRAFRIARYDDKTYQYLVDLVCDLEGENSERRQFLLRAHLGNYSLWLSGLFPDYVAARVRRRGAPGLNYYDDVGAAGYRLASECELAGRFDLAGTYRFMASEFRLVRRALNRFSDRFFFPKSTVPIERLLRQAVDGTDVGTQHK